MRKKREGFPLHVGQRANGMIIDGPSVPGSDALPGVPGFEPARKHDMKLA